MLYGIGLAFFYFLMLLFFALNVSVISFITLNVAFEIFALPAKKCFLLASLKISSDIASSVIVARAPSSMRSISGMLFLFLFIIDLAQGDHPNIVANV